MRIQGAVLAAALTMGSVVPAIVSAQSNEGGIASDIANEKAVRALYAEFVKAWNRHDPDALAAMWTIDGDHMEPDGSVAKGRDAVGTFLTRAHGGPFAKTYLQLSIADVWFLSDNVALVDGGYAVSGIRTPDGTELPERRGRITSVLLKEEGKWWIAASRLMIPTELPYKPSKPKE